MLWATSAMMSAARSTGGSNSSMRGRQGPVRGGLDILGPPRVIDYALSTVASFPGPLACDTETSDRRWWLADVGVVSFAWGPNEGQSFATRNVEAAQVALQYRFDAGLPVVFHNSGFDLHVLARRGLRIRWPSVHDSLLLARLANNLGQNDLGSLARVMLGQAKGTDGVKAWLHTASTKKGGFIQANGRKPNYLDVPDDILLPYATQDARLTIMLFPLLCQSANMPLYERERELRRLMFDAETEGVEVDPELIREKLSKVQTEQQSLEARLQSMHGEPINLDSDPQLRKWLYEDLGLNPVSMTPGGQPQVNEFSLTSNPHPVTRLLLTRNKRVKTAEFFESYLNLMDENNVIHPTINTLQARTHRFSCSDPNLQQIPSRNDRFKVREVFTAGDGWWVGCDYDKQELRIAAEEAGDTALLTALGAGTDAYVEMAQSMLNKTDISGSERQAAKVAVLSILYGAGAPKVAESFTVNTGHPYTVEQARAIRSNFKDAYPGLAQLMETQQEQAKMRGWIENRWGRRLFVQPDRAYVATDYLIQSSGRDCLADAILAASEFVKPYGGHIALPIHDELVFHFPSEPSPELLMGLADVMTIRKFSIPLTVKPKVGKSLADLK